MTMLRNVYLENKDCKLFWDFSVRTGHVIEARRPELLIIEKKRELLHSSYACSDIYIIDMAIPEDRRVRVHEDEKVKKY